MTQTTLREYARRKGIQYFSAWRHLQKGHIKGKKLKNGTIVIIEERKKDISRGKPSQWTEEKLINAVYKHCKGRYVKASDFPPYLYKLCNKLCGSVRAAKWKAKIIHGRHWTYDKFIKCVNQFCLKKYREDKDWPANIRSLAGSFCGSIRRAKWEAGIIRDTRRKTRDRYSKLEKLWTKDKFLNWVNEFCGERYRKHGSWPGYMRELAKRYCGSVRAAKHEAGILKCRRRGGKRRVISNR